MWHVGRSTLALPAEQTRLSDRPTSPCHQASSSRLLALVFSFASASPALPPTQAHVKWLSLLFLCSVVNWQQTRKALWTKWDTQGVHSCCETKRVTAKSMGNNSERVLLSFLGERPHPPAWMWVCRKIISTHSGSKKKGTRWKRRSVLGSQVTARLLDSWGGAEAVSGPQILSAVWGALRRSEVKECLERKWEEKKLRFRNRRKPCKGQSWNGWRTCIPKQLQLFNGKVLSRMMGLYQILITPSRATRWPAEYKNGWHAKKRCIHLLGLL